jgi:hypothetical protein
MIPCCFCSAPADVSGLLETACRTQKRRRTKQQRIVRLCTNCLAQDAELARWCQKYGRRG